MIKLELALSASFGPIFHMSLILHPSQLECMVALHSLPFSSLSRSPVGHLPGKMRFRFCQRSRLTPPPRLQLHSTRLGGSHLCQMPTFPFLPSSPNSQQ